MQVFRPISNNDLIVGAVGVLQFDVVVARLKSEYNVEAIYESVNVATARWVESADAKKFEEFKRKNETQLALDGGDNLTYIAPTMVNLNLTQNVTLTFSSVKRANTDPFPGAASAAPSYFPCLFNRLRNVLKSRVFLRSACFYTHRQAILKL